MKGTINKNIAPSDFKKFKRWFKTACSLDVSPEEAFESLGYKVPKKDVRKNPPTQEE